MDEYMAYNDIDNTMTIEQFEKGDPTIEYTIPKTLEQVWTEIDIARKTGQLVSRDDVTRDRIYHNKVNHLVSYASEQYTIEENMDFYLYKDLNSYRRSNQLLVGFTLHSDGNFTVIGGESNKEVIARKDCKEYTFYFLNESEVLPIGFLDSKNLITEKNVKSLLFAYIDSSVRRVPYQEMDC